MSLLLCIGMTGCGTESSSTETQVSAKSSMTENSKPVSGESSVMEEANKNTMEIIDKDSKHIGTIPFSSGMTLTNNGIFYTTAIL